MKSPYAALSISAQHALAKSQSQLSREAARSYERRSALRQRRRRTR
ncbi:hypothetical protein [Naumannella huperziae]